MKACRTQCKECPFRPGSMRGWLGDYGSFEQVRWGIAAIHRALWHANLFFCHTKIDYSNPDWKAKAEREGPLCLGFLKARSAWRLPRRISADPTDGGDARVLDAQRALEQSTQPVAVFATPTEWSEYHLAVLDTLTSGKRSS